MTIKYSEVLFALFFGLLLFAKGVGLYDGQTAFKLILVLAGLCLVGKMSLEKYNIRQFLLIIGILLLGGSTYFLTGEKGLLLNCMLLVGMHHMSGKKAYKIAGVIWTVAFIGTMISSLFHMEDTVYKVHSKLGLGHVFRWSFGYGHPNVLQISYLILAIIVIYLLGKNFRLWHAGALFLGNCFFFLYSLSYTGFATVACLLIGRVYLLYRTRLSKVEKGLLQMGSPICIFLSLVAPVVLEGRAFHVLNKLMNTRLELARYFMVPDYIHLWGNRLSEITTSSLTMDNSYVFAFIIYGIVPFAIIVLFTIYIIYLLIKREQYIEVLIFLVIAVGGLSEPFLYNTSFKNLSVVFMGDLLLGNVQKNEKYGLFSGYNKDLQIDEKRISKCVSAFREILQLNRMKILISATGAMIICVISMLVISYPEGYVVYRSDCADLEKVFHYYGEETGYEDYREMEEFQPGELVEYYSGNIIVLEKIRNSIMAFVLGFIFLYFTYGITEVVRKQHCRVDGRLQLGDK